VSILRGIGDDHPDGPDVIRDLVWGTALQNLPLEDEVPEHLLFERPAPLWGEQKTDIKLDAVVRREDTAQDCE
jgi:hypothetical protein